MAPLSMNAPLVTISVTTHNRPGLASAAIASALAQDLADVEVVIVDDGSQPPFQATSDDPRVRLVTRDIAGGPCAARNAALREARGKWITFLDDDDRLLPAMVRLSLEAAASSVLPAPVSVISGIDVVDQDGSLVERRLPPSLPRGCDYFLERGSSGTSYQVHNTLLVPTALLRGIGGWDEELLGTEHDDLFLRLNRVSSLHGLPVVTYLLSAHTGPRRSRDLIARGRAMERTARKHQSTFERHPQQWARYLTTAGVTHLRAGDWGAAVSATTRGLLINPAAPRAWKMWIAALLGPRLLALFRRMRTFGWTSAG